MYTQCKKPLILLLPYIYSRKYWNCSKLKVKEKEKCIAFAFKQMIKFKKGLTFPLLKFKTTYKDPVIWHLRPTGPSEKKYIIFYK